MRQATDADIPELVRLRALLFENLGGDFFAPPTGTDDWKRNLAAVLRHQLTDDDIRVLVTDADHGPQATRTATPLAACGIGTIEQRLPGPHLVNGRIGHVIGVVTDPAHRRRGHSRTIMQGLLDWFQHRGVARADLYASSTGEPLYRALGFTDHPDPSLYWRP